MWVAWLVALLPLAQVVVLECWDRVPHWVPCLAEGGGGCASPSDPPPPVLAGSHSLSLK